MLGNKVSNRPFAFTGVAAHTRIHLLQSNFRSSFGPSCRDLACCQRIPIHIFYRRDLENDGMVQMMSEKPLCSRWMRISTATPVNAKGLMKVSDGESNAELATEDISILLIGESVSAAASAVAVPAAVKILPMF